MMSVPPYIKRGCRHGAYISGSFVCGGVSIKTKEEISNGLVVLDSNSGACYSYRVLLCGQTEELGFKPLTDDSPP